MKRVNNLYDEIVDLKKIQRIYNRRVRINTKNKAKLERFENNYVSNMVYIKQILKNREYSPGKYNLFIIKEPKIRLIMSQNIIDKLINHVVSEYFLVNVFSSQLIEENIATRKDKGTHYGIKLLKKYLNELKGEEFYVLKFDISKYFFNLDHEIIKKIVRKKIKDKEVIEILDKIIDSTDEEYVNKTIEKLKNNEVKNIIESNIFNKKQKIKEIEKLPIYKKGKGLPIGNMSSQFFAILYLNELDHFVKEKLKIKHYIRYMDDGIILHKDKKYLQECLKEITKIIKKYKLELNDKTMIINAKQGFEFLGFKYNIKNNKIIMKVKNQTKRRFKRKMKKLSKLYNNKQISYNDFFQVKSSYLGHLSYGNTKKLVRVNLNRIEKPKELPAQSVVILNENIVYR